MGHRPMATAEALSSVDKRLRCSHEPVAHAGERLQFSLTSSSVHAGMDSR
jgi:hypothetical protein